METTQNPTETQTIIIDGKPYKLRPLKAAYRDMEAYVIASRPDPVAVAAEAVTKVPAALHPAIWDTAFRALMQQTNIVTIQEMANFENSIPGYAWKFWQCVKQDQPEIDSLDKAISLLERLGAAGTAELDEKLRTLAGEVQ